MTFEEFFIKKKIDLAHLRQTRPSLYEEFKSHYTQMGEKSFDHTKKYWFNRLRKDFLLREDPARPVLEKTAAIVSKSPISPAESQEATPAAPIAAPKPAGFKPRFKPGAVTSKPLEKPSGTEPETGTSQAAEEETPEQSTAASAKPAGFKPRFKPGVTTAKPAEKLPDAAPEPDPPAVTKPSGFKPRFKPGVTGVKKDPPEENN